MTTYPTLTAYTADVTAAVRAYANDQAVREGYCAACHTNRVRPHHDRRCSTCLRHGRGER